MNATVTALYVSFVKSCQLSSPQGIWIRETGLEGNKQFMIVDSEGKFLSQIKHPKMVTIPSTYLDRHLSVDFGPHPKSLSLDLLQLRKEVGFTECTCWIRQFKYQCWDLGDRFAEVVSHLIGTKCRLVEILYPHQRNYGPIYGVDSSPIHIVSEASLEMLNDRIGEKATMSMLRFRPSIVVSGCGPHEEDHWREIRIGANRGIGTGVTIRFRKLAERCAMTLVNPRTGEMAGNEPLNTLRTYRKPEHLSGMDTSKLDAGKVYLGSYWLGPKKNGFIKVGDEVEILERV